MASSPSYVVITMLDVLIRFGHSMYVMVFVGWVIGAIPLPITLEKVFLDDCPSGLFEYNMAVWLTAISLICILFAGLMIVWAKMYLTIGFQDKVDARRREQTADTSVIRWIIFSAQVMLVAAFASTVLLIFYIIQLKFIKFSCMDSGVQVVLIVLIGFMFAVNIVMMVNFFNMTKKTLEQIVRRVQ